MVERELGRAWRENRNWAQSASKGRFAERSHSGHARDAAQRVDHRFLFLERRVAVRFRFGEVHFSEESALRLEAERSMKQTHHAAHGNERCDYHERANGNLRAEQKVA